MPGLIPVVYHGPDGDPETHFFPSDATDQDIHQHFVQRDFGSQWQQNPTGAIVSALRSLVNGPAGGAIQNVVAPDNPAPSAVANIGNVAGLGLKGVGMVLDSAHQTDQTQQANQQATMAQKYQQQKMLADQLEAEKQRKQQLDLAHMAHQNAIKEADLNFKKQVSLEALRGFTIGDAEAGFEHHYTTPSGEEKVVKIPGTGKKTKLQLIPTVSGNYLFNPDTGESIPAKDRNGVPIPQLYKDAIADRNTAIKEDAADAQKSLMILQHASKLIGEGFTASPELYAAAAAAADGDYSKLSGLKHSSGKPMTQAQHERLLVELGKLQAASFDFAGAKATAAKVGGRLAGSPYAGQAPDSYPSGEDTGVGVIPEAPAAPPSGAGPAPDAGPAAVPVDTTRESFATLPVGAAVYKNGVQVGVKGPNGGVVPIAK